MEQLRVNEDDLELVRLDGGGMPIYHYNGKPFTGILISNYPDGKLCFEQEHKEGFEEGFYKSYHKNGQIKEEYESHNNITVEATYKNWDENGNLILSA